MEHRERIQKLIKEGKVNSDQAVLLMRALKESEARREKIFKQVINQKKKRQNKLWGCLSIWILIVLFVLGIMGYVAGQQRLGKNTLKALVYFEQANAYLEKEDYKQAIEFYKKGIKKAPRFSLGYSLLGAAYKLQYIQTKDEAIKRKEIEAFMKAHQLKEILNRRWKMNITALFFTFIFLVLIAGILSVIVLILHNILVRKEERVNEAWAETLTFLQRKLNLIPAVLEAAKNYAQHEKETHQKVTQARTRAQDAMDAIGGIALSKDKLKEFLETQKDISLGLGRLFALAEKYPELKANTNFLVMQEQIQEAEDAIARARNVYNERVRAYNATLRCFPSNLIATLLQFKPKEYFQTEGAS